MYIHLLQSFGHFGHSSRGKRNACTKQLHSLNENSRSICSPLQDAEACPSVPGNQTRGGENDVANGYPT